MSVTENNSNKTLLLTGYVGLVAAFLVGCGEFLLHFDPLARFSESGYEFMLAASDSRQTLGHFIGVFAAPFYIIGCWHIYLMLKPANNKLALFLFFIGSYGFILGGDWISSRASIGAIMHAQTSLVDLNSLIKLYEIRYETLLSVIRVTTLILSAGFIYLALTGRSNYKKWQAVLNPIVLLIGCFVVYLINKDIGKYIMPIALNVAFFIFFTMSIIQAKKTIITSNNKLIKP
jgi:hypothetical protein